MIEQRRAPAHDFSQRMLWLMGPELGKCPAVMRGFQEVEVWASLLSG